MNIWLINPFDELPGEGPEQRYACLARHLAARGHAVTWISADFHHRKKEKRTQTGAPIAALAQRSATADRSPPFSSEPASASPVPAAGASPFSGGSAALLLLPAPPYRSNTSLKRLHSHRVWARNVRAHLLHQVKSGALPAPDLILASTPPLEGAAAAIQLGKALKARVIIDVMDLWPENWLSLLPAHRSAQALGRLLLTPWTRLARRVFRDADALSAQSHAFGEYVCGNAAPHICYLGATPAPSAPKKGSARELCAFDEQQKETDKSAQLHGLTPSSSPALRLLYLGAMGRFYDIETVLQTMRLAKEAGLDWHLTLAGTDPEGSWQSRARELGLTEVVRFPGFLQREDLEALLRASQIGLIPMNPASGVAVPYKVGDYLAHGLPVVSSLPGELNALLTDTGAGLTYRFGDAEDLFNTLQHYASHPKKRIAAGHAAQTLFQSHFNREITYPHWAEWIEHQAAEPRR
jgi:glycosyltransferase involved in cell wall biosynthesis